MKRITYLFLLAASITLQSCFDIVETISLNDNGSGNFQLLLNMSRSKTKINSILKMKTVNGHPVPTREEIKEKLAGIEKTIRSTAGISNVKTSLDFENFIASIQCQFSNVNSLNSVVKNINAKEKSNRPGIEKNYEYDAVAKTFGRVNKFSLKNDYQQMSVADREVFATATYTGIFRFQSNVATASNKESKVAANKKAVMLTHNALDIITNKKSIENKITLIK